MKESKLKIILPIILIPVLVIVSLIGYHIYEYSNNFKSEIPSEKVLEYLQEKYEGDFEKVQLMEEGKTKRLPPISGCMNLRKETLYYNEFNYYYSAFSKKYDTEFVVAYANQLPLHRTGDSERKKDYIEDNLEESVNSNKIINDINKKLGNSEVEKEYVYSYDIPNVYINYCVLVNDNFNEEYNNKLIELIEELEKYNGISTDTKYTHCNYYIKFNDIYLDYSLYGYYHVIKDSKRELIRIENDEIWNYVGE